MLYVNFETMVTFQHSLIVFIINNILKIIIYCQNTIILWTYLCLINKSHFYQILLVSMKIICDNLKLLKSWGGMWGMFTKTEFSEFAPVSCSVIMDFLNPEILMKDFYHEDKCCTTGLGKSRNRRLFALLLQD